MLEHLKQNFFPHDQKVNHSKSLDGLRGMAALIVLVAHAANNNLNLPGIDFSRYGKVGVYMFFVLSAYLLDRQIIRAIREKKADQYYWINYSVRRFLRIYPLFFVALFIYYLANRKYVGNFIESIADIFHHLALSKGEMIFWSIPVEFKYYLISPFIILFTHKILKWNFTWTTVFLIFLIGLSLLTDHFLDLDTISTIKFFPVFLIGTFLAFAEEFKLRFLSWPNSVSNTLGILSILLILLAIPSVSEFLFGFHMVSYDSSVFLYFSSVMAILLITAHFNKGLIYRIFSNRILRFFGSISFSVYLLHWIIILLVNKYGFVGSRWNVVLFYSLTIVISSASYLIIEYPFSKVRISLKKIKTVA